MKNIKIRTNCWKTIDKKGLEPTKKDILLPKTKQPPQQDGRRCVLWYNQITYPPGGWTTNWKTVSQKFSHRSEDSEAHIRLTSLGIWHQEEEPSEHLALKVSGASSQKHHRTGGSKQHSQRAHKISHRPGPRAKSSDFTGERARYTCLSRRVSWGVGYDCGSLPGQEHWWKKYWRVLTGVSCPRGCHCDAKTWPHPIALRLQCWDASGQTINRVVHTPEEQDPAPLTSGQAPIPPISQLAQKPLKPATQAMRQSPKARGNTIQQPGNCKHRKSDKIRWQRNML